MIKSLIKPSNALIAGYSYLQSSVTKRACVSGMPVAISAELTNHCNLKCPECNSGAGIMTRSRGYMGIGLFKNVISELRPYLYYINLYFQGEPMLHPDFFSFLEICKGIRTSVSTNGHFLSAENAEKIVRSDLARIIVSLDGMDQQTYSSYRINGDINKVLLGIKNLNEAKMRHSSGVKLVIQFLVNKKNELQIPAVKRFARENNAMISLKSMQIINNDSFESWLPSQKKFRRYDQEGNGFKIKSSFPDRCARLWFNPVITWDGKVVPCCFDKDADHIMGNLEEESFRDIWYGPKYSSFRKSVLSGRHMTEICRNCTSGLKGVRQS
jgi:radical SAM protein with 4Fe4S-binding SPASM domain